MNELTVIDQINSVFSPKEIEMLEKFEEIKAQVEVLTKERTKALLPIMEKYYNETGNSSLVVGRLQYTYKKPHFRKTVDTNALKEQGLYEEFCKETEVKSSVSVKINYE